MTINLANNNPRANYTATSGQTAFTIPFDYFDDGDISVYQNGTLKTITTHYTISGSTMTLVTGATAGDKIAITRDVPLERTTDLTSTYSASSINNQLDTIVAQIADLDDRVSRSISLNDYEVGISLDLPATADRLGKTIQFNSSTGALEVGPSGDELTSIASIASEITALDGISSNITTVAGAITNVNNVGGSISSVNTVASSISNINTVNTNISNVNSVAGSITDVTDVADSIDQVELVATSISNVDIVGPAISNVNTVAGDITNINTVAGISANITTVAGITAAISTVNSNSADITSVANNMDDVNDVANVITKVTTVADNITNVNTLSSQASNIGTLAGISGSINSLGGISSDITTLAAVASDIGNAATNAASAESAKNAAEAARDATLAAYDSFDDRYLGAKSTEPTLDNDNNPLVSGSLYFDITTDTMKLYTGSAWVAAYVTGTGVIAASGGTMTGNLSFGDNDKAIFGAGSHLQIYHDSATNHSIITESGTGNLLLQADNLVLQKANGGKKYIKAVTDAQVDIYYDNAIKLATTSTGISVTGNATFADNGKAIFGAGSDLQIYHDGSNSFVSDQGVGNLKLQGQAKILLEDATSTDTYAEFNRLGDVKLYYSGSSKLSTTSTGVDITGTLTSDGLTVAQNGATNVTLGEQGSGDSTTITIGKGFDAESAIWFQAAAGNYGGLVMPTNEDIIISLDEGNALGSDKSFLVQGAARTKTHFSVQETGDISFYEDTGTTAKFFWDASAERLGIGTSSPSRDLEVYGAVTPRISIVSGNTSTGSSALLFGDADADNIGSINYAHVDNSMRFSTNSSERMRIDSSGNVGIGATSPDARLHIVGQASGSELAALKLSNNVNADGSGVSLEFADVVDLTTTKITSLRTGTSYSLQFFTTSSSTLSEKMSITGSGNVGIGTSSPQNKLSVGSVSDANTSISINSTSSGFGTLRFNDDASESGQGRLFYDHTNNAMGFTVNSSERMRIDSSGNVLVGTTDSQLNNESTNTGVVIRADNQIQIARSGGVTAYFNRLTSDGDIVQFRKDGSTVGSIGSKSSAIFVGTGDTGVRFDASNNQVRPWNTSTNAISDGNIGLGSAGGRFNDLYATNGTIQTSDQNEKQDIAELTDAEQRVAVAAKGLLRKFRWKDAVAEKGDEARTHFGIIAQDLQAAFAAEGLDAGDYAMFIYSTWTDEKTGEEKSRMGVRYSELLAFIIAAI